MCAPLDPVYEGEALLDIQGFYSAMISLTASLIPGLPKALSIWVTCEASGVDIASTSKFILHLAGFVEIM